MAVSGKAFDRLLTAAPTPGERIAWFGALLAKESRVAIEIVGGSAIEIHLTSRAYVSQDVDVVGPRPPLVVVLRRWGFREIPGRSARTYWIRKEFGLVDIVGPRDRSGLPPIRLETPLGPVLVSAVEPLILRRLWRAKREGSRGMFRQAVDLARGRDLDWDYLKTMAEYEGISSDLRRLQGRLRG